MLELQISCLLVQCLSTSLIINWLILSKEILLKYSGSHQLLPSLEHIGSSASWEGLPLDKHVSISLWFAWAWLPLFYLLESPEGSDYLASGNIRSPWVIYHNCHDTSHNSPEGLLPPMSSHLYLWQLECDLVWPLFDKSHLELINMGDTVPPWMGILKKERFAFPFNFHCSREGKGKHRRAKGRKEKGERGQEGERPGRWWEMLQVASPCWGRQAHTLAHL